MGTLKTNLIWQISDTAGSADFTLPNGISALIGKSGAGKTTLAKLLCGLIKPSGGQITLGDDILYDETSKVDLRPQARAIAYIPQEESLFPHMMVKENIDFGLNRNSPPETNSIKILGLETLLDRKPHTLSGGEKRRVTIARALMTAPKFIIMDEPTNGLDAFARHSFLGLVKDIYANTNIPILLISHQIDDIFAVADQLILMDNQHVIDSGPLEMLSTHPLAIALMGHDNIASLLMGERISTVEGIDHIDISGQSLYAPAQSGTANGQIHLRIRSNDVALSTAPLPATSIQNQLNCTITKLIDLGTMMLIELRLKDSDQYLRAAITKKSATDLNLMADLPVTALIKAVSVREDTVEL